MASIPSNLTAAWNSARTAIVLSWSNPSEFSNVDVTIQRSVNGGDWSMYAQAHAITSFTDSSASTTSYYTYRVGYFGTPGPWATTDIVPKKPNAPTNCAARRTWDTWCSASWEFGAFDETNMPDYALVERQTDAGSWVQVASLVFRERIQRQDHVGEPPIPLPRPLEQRRWLLVVFHERLHLHDASGSDQRHTDQGLGWRGQRLGNGLRSIRNWL